MPAPLRRSELSTPGSSPRMMAKAAASAADLVFLDLEDAVAPAARTEARGHIVEALCSLSWGNKLRAVRVNGAHTDWGWEDAVTIVRGAGAVLDALILPKVRSPRDVWFFETLLEPLEREIGRTSPIGFEILIEEAEAVARIDEIAACSPRIQALILGVGDLAAAQGIRGVHVGDRQDGYPGDLWHYARTRLVLAARANGLAAIDGPYGTYRDPEGYRREAQWATTLGFSGKWAIHPSQIEIANEVFAPSADEVAEARRIVAAYEAGERRGAGAEALDGVMVDAASVRIAEGVLARARQIDVAAPR